jgi:formate dehydrogenase iron-sulfur subunit
MSAPDGVATYRPAEAKPRMGFFTDTSVCIGCKACEVACKEWNLVPEDGLVWTGHSYDNTGELNANTWRHVAFIEQGKPIRVGGPRRRLGGADIKSRTGSARAADQSDRPQREESEASEETGQDFRWLMSSDVCKHCTHAGCLDVCPTGAIFRTEFGTVVIQDDVCNGCGYCVTACPFGVIGKRELSAVPSPQGLERTSVSKRELDGDGGMHKCTLCYDRLQDGLEPACSKACPTDSIQFGPLDELVARARERCEQLVEAGVEDARLYLPPDDGDGIGGAGAFFLLLDEPEVYGLPPDPVVPTRNLGTIWGAAGLAAGALLAGTVAAFAGGGR